MIRERTDALSAHLAKTSTYELLRAGERGVDDSIALTRHHHKRADENGTGRRLAAQGVEPGAELEIGDPQVAVGDQQVCRHHEAIGIAAAVPADTAERDVRRDVGDSGGDAVPLIDMVILRIGQI